MATRMESLRVDAALDGSNLEAGAKKATAALNSLGEAGTRADGNIASTQRTLNNAGRGFNRLAADLDPAVKAQMQLERGTATLNSALERGKITQDDHAKYTDLLQKKYVNLAPALVASRRHMEQYGDSTKMTRFQMLTMQYTINDVIASLASGISPFTILMQQGGQITQAWGGVGATFRALLNPTALLYGGIAGLVVSLGGLGYATESAERKMRMFEVSLAAVGRRGELTRGQIRDLVSSASALSGVGRGDAETAVGVLLSSRQVSVAMFSELIKIAGDFATVTGNTVPKALQELVNGLKSPTTYADQLHDRFGILTYDQYKHIEALEKSGKAYEANKIILGALGKQLDNSRKDSLTPFADGVSKLADGWEKLTNAFNDIRWVSNMMKGFGMGAEALANLIKPMGELEKLNRELDAALEAQKTFRGDKKYEDIANANVANAQAARVAYANEHGLLKSSSGTTSSSSSVSGSSGSTLGFKERERQEQDAARLQEKNFNDLLTRLNKEKTERDTMTDALDDQRRAMSEETEAYGKGDRERYITIERLKTEKIMRHETVAETAKQVAITEAQASAEYDARAGLKKRMELEKEFQQAIKSTSDTIAKSLVQSFNEGTTAAESFRQMFLKMLEQLQERALLKIIINPIANSMFGEDGTGGTGMLSGIGSFISSIFGGFNAAGGTVYPGHSYTVGENGRETFTPSVAGRITPSGASGASVNQNFNFNVAVSGSNTGDPTAMARAGESFAMAAKASIIKIIQDQKRPGGVLQGVA